MIDKILTIEATETLEVFWLCGDETHEGQKSLKLPKTNSPPVKIGRAPKGNPCSNHPFSGAFAVSFREGLWGMVIPPSMTGILKMGL